MMTKADAIEVLVANYPASCYGQLREAVDEAIDALSQPELIRCGECKYWTRNGRCSGYFADPSVLLTATDYCSCAERR